MKLSAWMDLKGVDDKTFAASVGADRSTINRIRNGQTIPTAPLMIEIARETAGAVQPNDFYDLPNEAAA